MILKERKPLVVSYCTPFLKPEMLHIYRQVRSLRRYNTFVITGRRENQTTFPFTSVVEVPKPRPNLISRFYLKYISKVEPLIYRGEYDQLMACLNQVSGGDLFHVYFGHIAVHLLPFLRRWDKPKIVSFHGMDTAPQLHHPNYAKCLGELFDRMNLVLVRSESLKHKVIKLGCPEEKIRLNRTGIPIECFPQITRVAPIDGKWKIIQACRLIQKKGIGDSLRAFAEFRQRFPQAEFHLLGNGPLLPSLQQLAASLNLGQSVIFHGHCSQDALLRLLGQSHIFIHPSCITSKEDQEGIPNSILEAMSTGLPIVATRHSGIPEAVRHGQDGLLVEEGDWKGLSECLCEFAANPMQWANLGASAADHVRKIFPQALQIENLERIYDEALKIRPLLTPLQPSVVENIATPVDSIPIAG